MSIKNSMQKSEGRAVFIPKESKHDDALFVAVNGQRILVKKGETVVLPERFAEAVFNSFAAQKQAESYIDAVSGTQ